MCVLIYKPSGIKMPSKRILKACFRANPHGAGFATPAGVHHSMNFIGIYRMLCTIPKEEPCILHFRLATTGSVCLKNCHPFKKNGIFFAHNGVLNIPTTNDMTDSETAFLSLYQYIEKFGLESDELRYAVQSIIGVSKFAIMQKERVKLFGSFTCIDGIYFSNIRWQHYM